VRRIELRSGATRDRDVSLSLAGVSAPQQKPLELILARNLLSSIITPALLVGEEGQLLFYNEAAAAMLGRRFEETGTLTSAQWTGAFGPFGADNIPIPYDNIPATVAVRHQRAFHGTYRIRAAGGQHTDVEASTIPIVGPGGSSGAVVIFWPVSEEQPVEGEDQG
jgi:PAS domain-containing protein